MAAKKKPAVTKGDQSVRVGVGKKAGPKSGAGYIKDSNKSRNGDLSGRGKLLPTPDPFGSYSYAENGRVNKRLKDKKKK